VLTISAVIVWSELTEKDEDNDEGHYGQYT
jgi:hypothetical protein